MVRTVARNSVAKRRHHEHPRLRRCGVLLEMEERTERRRCGRLLADFHRAVADSDRADAEGRAGVGEAGARDQLIRGGQIACGRILGEQQRATGGDRHGRPSAHRHHDVGLRLIGEIQHLLARKMASRPARQHPRSQSQS